MVLFSIKMSHSTGDIGTDFLAQLAKDVGPELSKAIGLLLTAGALKCVQKYCTSKESSQRLADQLAQMPAITEAARKGKQIHKETVQEVVEGDDNV